MMSIASFAFLVLLGRLYQLQILHGDEYKERADENFVKELRVPADRGFLVDRNHAILVDSRPSYDVTLTPYFCGKGCDDILDQLSGLLSLSEEELARSRDRLHSARGLERFRPFTVKVDIAREELDVVEANRVPGALSGVDVIPAPHRNYRYGVWASHLFGYMNEIGAEELKRANEEIDARGEDQLAYRLGDYIGRRGLERRWEGVLRGVDGQRRVVVDAKGNAKGGELEDLIPEEQRFEPSRPGKNLVLSLDWRLQEFAEKTFPGIAGVVLAMDAKTGFLLALVDRPAPDPNKLAGRITRAELQAIHSDPLRPTCSGRSGAVSPWVDIQGGDDGRRARGGSVEARRDRVLPGELQCGAASLALRQGLGPRDRQPGARAGRLLQRLLLRDGRPPGDGPDREVGPPPRAGEPERPRSRG
jgi:penicillin-binding protein 2